MTDPKKMAAMALEVLPPPDRLKRAKPMGDEGAGAADDESTEDSSTKAGELAMGDFKDAMASGDASAMFDALKRAVDACGSGDYGGG